MNSLQEKIKDWFLREKRDFAWRKNPHPYAVWISEVMLQQTRAEVVVDYFERWMRKFPTIEALANASLEEVIKNWEGLGYYSRARNLHMGAKLIVKDYQGIFPSAKTALFSIKGIGPYTAGAILSFAFHQKAAAIDGNVTRIASRLFFIQENIEKLSTQKKIKKFVEEFLPEETPWIVMEALIELGATICKKKPLCHICPVNEHCLAFKKGFENSLPLISKIPEVIVLHRFVPIIYHDDEYLVQYHQGKKIMADLYEFPYFSDENAFKQFFPGELIYNGKLTKVTHTFTKYRAHLFPSLWKMKKKEEIAGFRWVPLESLLKLPFSSGHRRILQQLMVR